MKYQRRPPTVDAVQWFKNGDHPLDGPEDDEGKLVRYFRRPDIPGTQPCPSCDRAMHAHGWIDSGGAGQTVCPGDFIVTPPGRKPYTMKPDAFALAYTKDHNHA